MLLIDFASLGYSGHGRLKEKAVAV